MLASVVHPSPSRSPVPPQGCGVVPAATSHAKTDSVSPLSYRRRRRRRGGDGGAGGVGDGAGAARGRGRCRRAGHACRAASRPHPPCPHPPRPLQPTPPHPGPHPPSTREQRFPPRPSSLSHPLSPLLALALSLSLSSRRAQPAAAFAAFAAAAAALAAARDGTCAARSHVQRA